MKFDLHSHSHFSDGELSPSELLKLAAEHDITHLALTDHDTVAGIADLKLAALEIPVTPVIGVEFSSEWRGQLLHIVGLNVDPENDSLQTGINQNTQKRWERAERMHDDFSQHDIDLREAVDQQLQSGAVPTRPHFANALIGAGLAKDKKQAFKRFLVRGKPGYVPMPWPSLAEVSGWIKDAGGIAVLAHPLRYRFTRSKLQRLIVEMQAEGIGAIEVSTPGIDEGQFRMLASLAQQHHLFASMGSDFHGPSQPWARLGSARNLPDELTPVWDQF